MVINHFSNKTDEEKIHVYFKLLDYIYNSKTYQDNEKEQATNEEADSNICKAVNR